MGKSAVPLEILAPAGSPDALTAAVRAGADAVYLGGGGFNARRNAHNFDTASLREAVSFCHARGVKVHFTLNTLIREEEMPAALTLAEEVCALGVDALIVQDLGLARAVHAAAPAMPLHASTQLSCHTPAGVRELAALGFSRVVLAREMSREEIAACAGQGAELEIFVHGALCMSVSGQCGLSAMLGGRSGNRGLCAQPCRLPFCPSREGKLPNAQETALSLRDLSLWRHVGEFAELGVCSLKIEGRMKRPEYVAAATAAYAAARDGMPEEAVRQLLDDLQSVFSRSGFTDGYYTGQRGKGMFGSRRKEDVLAAAPVLGRLSRLYERETARIPVSLTLTMRAGEPVSLRVVESGCSVDAVGRTDAPAKTGNAVIVTGPLPEPAVNRPLTAERAAAQLSRTGGTPFTAASVACDLEEGLTLPAAALNALRREALEALLVRRAAPRPVPFDPARLSDRPASPVRKDSGPPALVARFARAEQIPDNPGAQAVILPLGAGKERLREWAARTTLGVEIPRGLFGREEEIARQLTDAAEAGARFALCGNIGAIPLAREAGLSPLAGFGMNLTNAGALAALEERGTVAAVLSQELTFSQTAFAKTAGIPCGLLAYGRQPLMLMRNCPYQAAAGCKACGGNGSLTDRKGIRFPIRCEGGPGKGGCAELLNSAPLYLTDRLRELPPVDFLLLHFTDETKERAAAVLREYRAGGTPPEPFTRGLYRRGVD